MRARVLGVLALSVALGACGDDGELSIEGETGYVRCLAAQPPAARSWRVGSLRLALDDERRLRIEGAPNPWRLAVFTGPADRAELGALRRQRPHVAAVLGGLGEEAHEVSSTMMHLAELGVPVLVVAGGADRLEHLEQAYARLEGEGKDRVIPAWPLRSVRIGSIELAPLAGAPDGRYAIAGDACGFSADDVAAVAEALGEGDGLHRYLLSWAAPRGGSASLGVGSVEAGSPLVSGLMERSGAAGALFAWPVEAAGRVDEQPLRAAVRPLSGPWILRADGTRARPGATLLTAGGEGLAVQRDSP